VVGSLERLATSAEVPPVALVVDGAYEYTAADLTAWDAEGPGSTCKRYYARYEALVRRYGLPPEGSPGV
jgi:hypothetical protein